MYLIATVIFDAVRVRTQWLGLETNSSHGAYAGVLTASLAVKCIIFILEAIEKRSLLLGLGRQFSKESTSGLLSRSSFWWLNTLLLSGFRNVLTVEDLPAIYEKLDSESLAARLEPVWQKCKRIDAHGAAWASDRLT